MTEGIRCYAPQFLNWCVEFAGRWPAYRQKDGSVNAWHIYRAVQAEGFDEINADNLDCVKAALERRAARKTTEAKAKRDETPYV